jgi:signal transduction histidine kinase
MQYLSISQFAFMPVVFLLYGLAFFMLGIAIGLQLFSSSKSPRFQHLIGTPWGTLAVFAILHGTYEIGGAFNLLYGGLVLPLEIIRLYLLPLSFYFLCKFGISYGQDRESSMMRLLPGFLAAVWVILSSALFIRGGLGQGSIANAGILSRYVMGLPGAVMASFALMAGRKAVSAKSRKYLVTAAGTFALYAVALCITQKADFFPASFLNYENFFRAVHVPTQVFRTLFAIIIAFSFIKFFQLSKSFTGIRFKAVLHVIVAVVVPAFCIILLVSYLMSDALLRVSYKENEKLASLAAREIQASLSKVENGLKYNLFFARLNRSIPVEDLLAPFLMENPDIRSIAFFDGNDDVLRVRRDPQSQAINFSRHPDRPRMGNFLSEAPISVFHMGRHDDTSVSMVFPLPRGRIEVLLDLRMLYQSIQNLRTGPDWHVLLADAKGGLVVHGSGREPMRRAVFKLPGARRDNYGKTTAENGRLYNAVEAKIEPIGWSLVTEIPRSEIVEPIFDVFKGLAAGILLIYLSAVAAVIFSLGKVTAPINLIAQRVRSIGRGDLTSAVNIKTGDEVQTLSEEVEKMAVMLVEKKEMEKRLMQTQKIAALGRLVSAIAHEINNPLSVIIWSSQLLLREIRPEERHHQDLRMLEKHALACKKIVDDLLRFTRTDKQANVEVDVNSNLEEALALVGKHFSKSKVSIVMEPDPSSPKVMGDPGRLHQVFLNLTMNAVDAMKNGGGSLTIGTRSFKAEADGGVEITFSDTGCGISPENIERIFDPFFTTKAAGEGTGIGLAVSYGIVSDHNGRMWVESEEGKGSTFHVVLPAVKEG